MPQVAGPRVSNGCTLLLYFCPRCHNGPHPGTGEVLWPVSLSVELRGLEPLIPSLRTARIAVIQACLSSDQSARRHASPVADDGVAVLNCCTSRRCGLTSADTTAPTLEVVGALNCRDDPAELRVEARGRGDR